MKEIIKHALESFATGIILGTLLGMVLLVVTSMAVAHDEWCDGVTPTGALATINSERWIEINDLVHFGSEAVHMNSKRWIKESDLVAQCAKFQ